MLHADSGLKKGPPIAMARKLVNTVNNTRVITGRSSIQGILKEMGTGTTAPGGKIKADSAAFICSSELSSSIVGDKVATDILTDLYDRHYNVDQWKSLLKMESFELRNPTITMFTATNEAHSSDFFASKDVQGGYFARTFIIAESVGNRDNSLSIPLTNPPNLILSAEYLKKLSKLRGAFQDLGARESNEIHHIEWTNPSGERAYFSDAGIIYEQWYHNFKDSIRAQAFKDETGTLNRFGDSVLKVAMLLSLARDDSMIINECDMNEAIKHCEKLVGNVRRTTLGSRGLSITAAFKTQIIHELMSREDHRISKQVLMKKMWMHFSDIVEFEELMGSLEASGLFESKPIGSQTLYQMSDKTVDEWTNFFAGKMSKSNRSK